MRVSRGVGPKACGLVRNELGEELETWHGPECVDVDNRA